MKTEHELKCWGEYFGRIQSGQKTFEIRKNDRDFQVGDILLLREFDQEKGEYIDYSTPVRAEVVYMTTYAQQPGYVVMGIKPETEAQ
jgi:ASC-1-like (ASCH) protein